MTDASSVLNQLSWWARIKRAVPQPWFTMLQLVLRQQKTRGDRCALISARLTREET